MSMKNSIDTIGNRSCNLLACSAVPQPAAKPRAPVDTGRHLKWPHTFFVTVRHWPH